jgi:hypothetical protein
VVARPLRPVPRAMLLRYPDDGLNCSAHSIPMQIISLNCFGLGLTSLRENLVLPALAVLSASSNDLTADSLAVLSRSPCLRELYLRNNQVSGPLSVLAQLPVSLRILWLEGNPIAALPGYRAAVLSILPLLESLDGEAVTAEERRARAGPQEVGDPATAGDEPAPLAEAILQSGPQHESLSRVGRGGGGGTGNSTATKESSVLRAILLLLRELTPAEQAVVMRACR